MEEILSKISTILSPDCKILIHSKLNQNLLDDENTILWNNEPLKIDEQTYNDFKDAIKRRGHSHYTKSDTLQYPDFCIALLCASNYSLNHNNIHSLQDRTFIATWRALTVVSATSNTRVSQWINKYISDRTSDGYQSTFHIENLSFYRRKSIISSTAPSTLSVRNLRDENVIDNMKFNETVIDLCNNDNDDIVTIMYDSSSTPEGQLEMLRMLYDANMYTDF